MLSVTLSLVGNGFGRVGRVESPSCILSATCPAGGDSVEEQVKNNESMTATLFGVVAVLLAFVVGLVKATK